MSGPRLSIIPARAATDRALKPRDLQVLCVLGRHTDDLGWCRRSQVKMAEEMGCARATVFEAIERLVKAGYLERHVQAHESGRDSAHVYRVVLDTPHPQPGTVPLFSGDRETHPADQPAPPSDARTPAGMSAPPAGPEPAPPAGPGPAPINDTPLTAGPNGEREARAGEPEERQPETPAPADDPRKFEFRVKRLAERLKWPGWSHSSTAWSVAQFAKLSDAERAEAERLGEAYVKLCGKAALSIGTYFAERKWTTVPPELANPPEPMTIEAKPFGPVWGGAVLRELVTVAPKPAPPPSSAFLRDLLGRDDAMGAAERRKRQAAHGWPQVRGWFAQAESRRGFSVAREDAALAALTEPVPVGSELFARWRAHFEASGWPWLPDPGAMPVVYLPRGGPEDIEGFREAVAQQHEHGGGREAAE